MLHNFFQEDEVMREFEKVKALLDQQNVIDEDEYKRTKVECLVLGGKLTDIRRRQRRLSGQVEELESTIKELIDQTQNEGMDDEEFDLEMFKRRPLEDEPRLAPTLSSYSLFNNAPFGGTSQGPPIKITTSYSSDSLAFGASDDGASEIPENPSPIPSYLQSDRESDFGKYFKGRDTADVSYDVSQDVSQDEREEAYFPQSGGPKRKKKKRSEYTPRNRTESMSSDTDAEEVWTSKDGPFGNRMSSDEAKKVAEAKQKLIEEEKRREEAEQLRIREEMETKQREENEREQEKKRIADEARIAELVAKKKEEEDRKKEELEAKRLAAEEKRKAFEEKKKAELEAKKKEEEEKKKAEAEKKKAELEAKRAAAAEKKKALEKKKQDELEAKLKAEEELKKQQDEAKAKIEEEKRMEQVRIEEEKQIQLLKIEEEKRIEALKQEEEQRFAEAQLEQASLRAEAEREASQWEVMQRQEEELQQQQKEVEPKKPIKKTSRSASRDRQAASKMLSDSGEAEVDDMIYDESHQIKVKEDLFAMIGDTSLKGGKFRRKKQSTGEDDEEELPSIASRSKKNSTSSLHQDETNMDELKNLHAQKPRTPSRERQKQLVNENEQSLNPSDLYSSTDSMIEKTDEFYYNENATAREEENKYYTSYDEENEASQSQDMFASNEPFEHETDMPHKSRGNDKLERGILKSRTSSRERPGVSYNFEEEEEVPIRKRQSRPGSQERKETIDLHSQTSSQKLTKSRTASRERPENQNTDRYDQDEEDFEMMNENNLKRKSSHNEESSRSAVKSRTQSRERPSTWDYEDMEKERDFNLQATTSGGSGQDTKQGLKSRTVSRERPATQELNYEEDYEIKDERNVNLRPSSRPGSRLDTKQDLKSRTASRERPATQEFDYEEDYEMKDENDVNLRSSSRPGSRQNTKQDLKSRTASRERPATQDYHYEDDEMENEAGINFETSSRPGSSQDTKQELKSRTASRERTRSSAKLIRDEENEQEEILDRSGVTSRPGSRQDSKQNLKSRTSSRERPISSKSADFDPEDYETEANNQTDGKGFLTSSRPQSRQSQQDAVRGIKSRTASRDRKQNENLTENDLYIEKEFTKPRSRTASRDRGANKTGNDDFSRESKAYVEQDDDYEGDINYTQQNYLEEELEPIEGQTYFQEADKSPASSALGHYKVGENEDIYAQVRTRREKVTHSRTTSRERPGSSARSESQQVGLDDDFDDEDVPGLEAATDTNDNFRERQKRLTKSRTASFEKNYGDMSSNLRKNSTNGFENQVTDQQLSTEQTIKSRTTSRERPETLDLTKQNRSRTASRERPMEHVSLQDQLRNKGSTAKSRSVSKEARKNPIEDPEEEEDFSSARSSRLIKSRTASRERREGETVQGEMKLENTFVKSRTHSRDRRHNDAFPQDMEDDVGYDTMNGRLKRYRDEEALDLAAAESLNDRHQSDYDTLDSGISDYYKGRDNYDANDDISGDDQNLFRDRVAQQDQTDNYPRYASANMAINPEYDLDYSAQEYYQNKNEREHYDQAYNEGQSREQDENYLIDDDDQQSRSRTKKVSFAEADEKFVLRPDPEVKIIPGTKLFCFAPSETHEQPPEPEERSPQITNGNSFLFKNKDKENIPNTPPGIQSPARSEERQVSTSPKAFLKAMLGSAKQSKENGDNVERKSLFDTLLRRGRSASLQGSRSNSRQSSLDRGAVSEKGASRNFSTSISFDAGVQQGKGGFTAIPAAAGGSSRATDSSVGSVELNIDQDGSDMESEYSLFKKSGNKKKKPPKVKSVDFDQLFARGHAIGEQREKQTQSMTGLSSASNTNRDFLDYTDGNQPTPFELYSKEDAFKQAQQGAGISYEEKVQSYLDDQQHQHGVTSQQQQLFSQYSRDSTNAPLEGHESRRAERKLKKERSRSDSNRRVLDQSLERKKEVPKTIGYTKPEDIHIDISGEPVIQASPPATLQRPGSRMSASGRSVGPDEFLQNIQEFVRKAEVDQEYSQPVWPAIIQSPNELPPTKAQAKANAAQMLPGQRYTEQTQFVNSLSLGNVSPRPVSPYDNQNSYNQSFPTTQQSGFDFNRNQDLAQRPVSPYAAQPSNNLEMQRKQSSDGRLIAPNNNQQRPPSPYQQQLPSQYEMQRQGGEYRDRMAPSPGKSYLEMKPSTLPDPFQSRFDNFDVSPPTPAEAASLILKSLRPSFAQEQQGFAQDQRPTPSPRRGRSPRMDLNNIPGDAHIPAMLRPDPLTAHELMPPPIIGSTLHTTQQLRLANGNEEEPAQTIRDTDLYKRLQEGLKNIDKILASESFQEKIQAAGLEYQKYSHHLGRAEFGVLKKRSGSTASVPTAASSMGGGPLMKSASAAALSGAIPKGNSSSQRAGKVFLRAFSAKGLSTKKMIFVILFNAPFQQITKCYENITL